MFDEKYTINRDYISTHPNMTLQEFLDEYKNNELKKKQEESERYKKEVEYYNSLKDKYFIINFNNSSYLIVYVDKELGNRDHVNFHCYSLVYWDKDRFEFKEESRPFNNLWFDNPYGKNYCTYGKPIQWCKEITKEEYEAIVNMIGSCKTVLNHIKDVSLSNK